VAPRAFLRRATDVDYVDFAEQQHTYETSTGDRPQFVENRLGREAVGASRQRIQELLKD
jgi:hypothetical protein